MRSSSLAASDPATEYAEAVLAGRIVAGPWVRLACERHLRDLKDAGARGLRFDAEAAAKAIQFFGFLRLPSADGETRPFTLMPFQAFIIGTLFGWKKADGSRRFRRVYIEIGKGSGKTPLGAGIGLMGMVGDNEPAAEVYAAAVTRDQAGILFTDAKRMVEASPALSSRLTVNVANIAHEKSGSWFRPVSAEAKSLDGKRVHMGLIDEVHEHPSSTVVDKMSAGRKGRRQPLIVELTNAGHDRHTVCWQHHEYSVKVLQGVLEDDEWFAFVCALDACEACKKDGALQPIDGCTSCDDWRDEAVWEKTNPGLGVIIQKDYLRAQVREAVGMPAQESIVKRLNFCIWVEAANPWLSMDLWDAGSGAVGDLRGRECYIGLDLSQSVDLSAMVKLFPPVEEGEPWKVLVRFWIPDEGLGERIKRDHVPYDVWIHQGYIETCPGPVIDQDFIEAAIKADAEEYRVREVAYDRMFATGLIQHLTDAGLVCVGIGQGFYGMAAPTQELERIVKAKQLQHGGHPILRWCASNVVAVQDPAGNLKPDKSKSTGRIDGISSLLMALGRASIGVAEGASVYEERGFDVW